MARLLSYHSLGIGGARAYGNRHKGCGSSGDRSGCLVAHRKVHRIGDEAGAVRLLVQRLGAVEVATGGDGDPRVQHHLGEAAAAALLLHGAAGARSEEHTSELQSLMRISYAVLCLKKKT